MRCLFRLTSLSACAVVVLTGADGRALAGGGAANNHLLRLSQEHGFTFSEIGDPGNKAVVTRLDGDPEFITTPRGTVNYRYRIMTREVTVGEYLQFANTVGVYLGQLGFSSVHIGGDLLQSFQIGGGGFQFYIPTGDVSPAEAMRSSFAGTAMFANWLHNDKGTGIEAFQNGAYDISTFRPVAGDAAPRGQESHNAEARYWIPTTDEWLKAGYWDPNRSGDGEGGWWEQPNATDTQLIPGRPEFGGQTNGGSVAEWPAGQMRPLESGLYPDVQSPWGLIDVSGGAAEWTESFARPNNPLSKSRLIDGTDARLHAGLIYDNVDLLAASSTGSVALWGIRLAAVVPSPSGAAVLAVSLNGCLAFGRRRQCLRMENDA